MINHVRTLLLNRGRDGHSLRESGEEYVPSDYVPRRLPTSLQLIRSILFGGQPDRLFLNYRLHQFMQLLHSTPLAVDIYRDDRRVTYIPFTQEFFSEVFKATVTQVSGVSRRIDIVGSHTANSSNGLAKQVWEVSVAAGGIVTVTKRRGVTETREHRIVSDTPVTLHGSDLSVFLHNATVGTRFEIESTAYPVFDAGSVLQQASGILEQYAIDTVFPTETATATDTWRRIWSNHPDVPMRLAAMLLGIAYTTSQLPQES